MVKSLEDNVINDLSKVLIPSSNNVTTGNTLQKFLGQTNSKNNEDKLNLMDDHISKVGASSTIYFPSGNTAKVVENKIPDIRHGEVLIKILWLSLDPYMRGRMSKAKSYAASLNEGDLIVGGAVGRVINSGFVEIELRTK